MPERCLGVPLDFAEARRRLVEELKAMGYIRSWKVERAMLKVPREEFVPEDLRLYAYEDRPLPIGYGQTISAPSIVAYMTELLDPDVGHKVLEVGTGSGYQAAVLAEIVAPEDAPREEWGHVWSIERIPELAEFARRNLERTGYADRVTVVVGDGTLGLPEEAPFDRIIVTAAAPRIPEPLLDQLKPGGRLVAPVGDRWAQDLVLAVKNESGEVEEVRTIPVIFVPLVGRYGFREEG
ncbi:protein-L-isoaspartate(D-aspartate) O-methyltransferase [Stetteria hydrogenophila]